MMPIIKSTYALDNHTQADGRTWVREEHTDHNGHVYTAEYLAPHDFDYSAVMSQRASNIGADIDKQEAIRLEAQNYELPLTWYEFMDRFAAAERKKIRQRANTNEDVADFIDLAKARGVIYRSSPRVSAALDVLIALGDLDPARKAEVLV